MMDVLKATEGQPARYVETAVYDGDDAPPGTAAALWQRIEFYIAHRWHERPVEWIICGSGAWTPPLVPTAVDTIDVWAGDVWQTIAEPEGPLGFEFVTGTYRVIGTAGKDGDPPAAVLEAFNRLFGYLADEYEVSPAATRFSLGLGELTVDQTRPTTWQARALQYSGAADLLRPYRRA